MKTRNSLDQKQLITVFKAFRRRVMYVQRMVMTFLLSLIVGKKSFQSLWEKLHLLSLKGMNIGTGGDPQSSGEIWVIKHIATELPKKRQAIIFDIGANKGSYASQLLYVLGNTARIYCFEPSRKAFEMLHSNLSKHDNVFLYNFGFGDKEEELTLYSDHEGSGLASVYKRRLDHHGITVRHEEKVSIMTLDGFCSDAGIEHIDFLKVDVEGHELKVLLGGRSLISSGLIDFIQFEFGGCNIDSRTYFQDYFYLLNERYRIFRILRDGLYSIDQYREYCEVFTTTNYLAVSRKLPQATGQCDLPRAT